MGEKKFHKHSYHVGPINLKFRIEWGRGREEEEERERGREERKG
jgi:hypothetical protein